MSTEQESTAGPSTRWPELVVALVLMGVACLILVDSLRVGIGWADDGPRSGYFPFIIGCLLFLAAGSVALGQLWRWKRDHAVFVEPAQWASVRAMAWPMTAYVLLIAPLGIYVASALLIGYFMHRHGRYRWFWSLLVALGVPLLFFIVFERWFLVLLPKGPLERLLGY
ncbi:MAG: tripartite tricarboxylate transporter TctB family protein [Burkholderiales bacterium]